MYIQNVLTIYGFWPCILNWVNNFFSNREACILMKGYFTERIFLRQGVPQEDIIRPNIFILAVEILLIKSTSLNISKGLSSLNMKPEVKPLLMTLQSSWKEKRNTLDIQWNVLLNSVKYQGLNVILKKPNLFQLGTFTGRIKSVRILI